MCSPGKQVFIGRQGWLWLTRGDGHNRQLRQVANASLDGAVAAIEVLEGFDGHVEVRQCVFDEFPAGQAVGIRLAVILGDVHGAEDDQTGVECCDQR